MPAHDRVDAITSALAAGRSLEEVSKETGVPLQDLEVWSALYAAAREDLARRGARRRLQGLAALALAVAGLVAFTSREALAQACAQTLPAPMVTFCPESPARAVQVNANFQQLVTWLTQKVGAVGSSNVNITGSLTVSSPDGGAGTVTMNGAPLFGGSLTVDGGVSFVGGFRQAVNLSTTAYGVGSQTNTTYFRSPRNFAWYQNGAHHDGELNAGGGAELMRLVPSGELISRGMRQVGTAAPVPYEVSSTRLVVEATPAQLGSVVPINQPLLDSLCRDVDGCQVTMSMVGWSGDGRAATRSGTLFLSETSNAWRVEVAATDIEGVDGDNGVAEWSAWDCYFTDEQAALNTNNGRADNAVGFGLLNCRGCAYNDALTTCRLVFRD